MISHMLNKEKTKSILKPSKDITLLLYLAISNRKDLALVSFKQVCNFLIKFADFTFKKLIRIMIEKSEN